ncbi:unnamed protein product [Camellia sinensis]
MCIMVMVLKKHSILQTVFMQLPDYHEIIEGPMDFRTVRMKLEEGRYSNLDEFQSIIEHGAFLCLLNLLTHNHKKSIKQEAC